MSELNPRITEAMRQLTAAIKCLSEWEARGEPTDGRHWVAAGHDAVAALDLAVSHLSTARRDLVGAMRRDEDEQARRIDARHAQLRHERTTLQAGPGGEIRRPIPPMLGGEITVMHGVIVAGPWDGPTIY